MNRHTRLANIRNDIQTAKTIAKYGLSKPTDVMKDLCFVLKLYDELCDDVEQESNGIHVSEYKRLEDTEKDLRNQLRAKEVRIENLTKRLRELDDLNIKEQELKDLGSDRDKWREKARATADELTIAKQTIDDLNKELHDARRM